MAYISVLSHYFSRVYVIRMNGIHVCVITLFQSATDAINHGLSMWLPQLQNCSKSTTASAEDSVEVCTKFTVYIYISVCLGFMRREYFLTVK